MFGSRDNLPGLHTDARCNCLITERRSNRRAVSDVAFAVSIFAMGLVVAGLGVGFSSELSGSQNSAQAVQVQTSSASGGSGVYAITLVITSNDQWNSSTSAPRYWVVTPTGLESAANLSLPAHRLIQLTIEDFDTPSPGTPSQYSQVTGTVGNTLMMMNATAASQNPTNASNYSVVGSLNPDTQIAHTFTIPQLGINIPSAANSVEVADFTINQTGVFAWQCMDPCGFGPSGWLGPMSAAGWMQGSVTVS